MVEFDGTLATRRHLPHLEKQDRTYFVTFSTVRRLVLPPKARDRVLACCVHDHKVTYWLEAAVVMPDHVHMIFTPYEEYLCENPLRAGLVYHVDNYRWIWREWLEGKADRQDCLSSTSFA